MKRVAVFASGSGSNFQSLSDSITNGSSTHFELCGLIASRPGIKVLERADRINLPSVVLKASDFPNEELFADALYKTVSEWKADYIALAGYLTKLPNSFIQRFPGTIVNIHPSLLPKFGGQGYYGLRVHQAVLQAGEKETGCTVHLVDGEYDTGKILAQLKLEVNPGESPEELAERVLKLEHELYPIILEDLAKGLDPLINSL